MLDATADSGDPALRVWTPGAQVAFGRRDARADGADAARAAAERRGFPVVERSVGGRAVAYTETTLAFAYALPLADMREGLDERYETAVNAVVDGLSAAGADVEQGEPPRSYCPGDYSVRAVGGGKVAGVAQRVRQRAALVSGCVTVDGRDRIRDVLSPVYGALGVPFDPDSVGSVAAAGGAADPDAVRDALETAILDGFDAAGRVDRDVDDLRLDG
ncbi:lipoyl protein ligase domain-containing protein [Halobaculum sp. P14]|uniref:lipoyl protein ligase domain-containing protein n=1 Tax=Halobaculum sp. P14 TaxID=3421638 RepID=UPI003EBB6544